MASLDSTLFGNGEYLALSVFWGRTLDSVSTKNGHSVPCVVSRDLVLHDRGGRFRLSTVSCPVATSVHGDCDMGNHGLLGHGF